MRLNSPSEIERVCSGICTTPSRYIKSTYQRNPFNIVSLILSYGLASSISKTIEEDKGYYEYCIPEIYNGQYSIGNLISGKNFRIIIIKNDFKAICLNIISNHCIEKLKNITETEIFKLITAYYENSSKLLYQLCDKTIHPLSLINFRKNIDFDQIWKYLSRQILKIIKLKKTKESFINELLSHANRDLMINSNMAIHEILSSIDCFINQHIKEIETLYQ